MNEAQKQVKGNLPAIRFLCPLLFVLALSFGFSVCVAQEVTVLESDETGVVLSYRPGVLTTRTVGTDSGEAEILRFAGCGLTEDVGLPMLPRKPILVGIPPEVDVGLQIVSLKSTVQEGYSIAPVPQMKAVGADGEVFFEQRFVRDPQAYRSDVFSPSRVASVGNPSLIRNQRVVEVVFSPVRYNPVRQEIAKAEQIVVKLSFSPSAGRTSFLQFPANEEIEEFYRRVLVNYQSAREWRLDVARERPLAGEPVFPAGRYVKINVETDGIYCIRWSDLEKAGINPAQIDPVTIKMFYGGGRELDRNPAVPPPVWQEIPIVVDASSEYILFYGNRLSGWDYDGRLQKFIHFMNHYAKENSYWLRFDETAPGRRIAHRDGTPRREGILSIQDFSARIHQETERYSTDADETGGSGIDWYWDKFSSASVEKRYPFLTSHPDTTKPCMIRTSLSRESGRDPLLRVSLNGETVDVLQLGNARGMVDSVESRNLLRKGSNYLGLKEVGTETTLRLDWLELEYTEGLTAEVGELFFTAPISSEIAEFRIAGVAPQDSVRVFEVSNPFEVTQVTGDLGGENALTFQDSLSSDIPRQYYVVSKVKWKTPKSIVVYENNLDLREEIKGRDYIIVTYSGFWEMAQTLAQWRARQGLSSTAVKVDDIYNQFSWGVFDPTAIRNFLKHLSENGNPDLRYVLLLGDGCYDYKNNSGISPGNFVPPYESEDLTTDDWFADFDEEISLPSLAVGRLPAKTRQDAEVMIKKILDYEGRVSPGVWQNTVLMVADDDHVRGKYDGVIDYAFGTENIARDFLPQSFDQIKLYLTEYTLDAFGKKLQARKDFIEALNQGVVLVNYVGHANYTSLSHESLFEAATDMSLVNNGQRLPFIFGATCSIAHFDHPINETIFERFIRKTDGGMIAGIGPTRMAYNDASVPFNEYFYQQLFVPSGDPQRIGQAMLAAKHLMGKSPNTQKYNLLGDPALLLAVPQVRVSLSVSPDTLKALGKTNISCILPDDDFRGQLYVKVFDSVRHVTYNSPGGESVSYLLPGLPLFRGVFPIEDERFQQEIRIPKDISYGSHGGRVSVFVWNGAKDGCGKVDSLFVGGTAYVSSEDTRGPDIAIGIQGQNFADGDYTGVSPLIQATIEDENGINITGETGHEITITVDDLKIYDVTERLVCQNSYRRGFLEYQLENLSEGEHTLVLKAWDTSNNSAAKEVALVVTPEDKFSIRNALCYPNPMNSETVFTYELTQPAEQVKVKVFSVSGKLIDEFEGETSRGYNQAPRSGGKWFPPVSLANGVYLYKIQARSTNGRREEIIEKLSVLR